MYAALDTDNVRSSLYKTPAAAMNDLQSSQSSSASENVLGLPEELLVGVLSHLALADLCRTAAACRTLRRVATDDRVLWRARCLDRFGPGASDRAEGRSWEQHWDALVEHHTHGCALFNKDAAQGIDYLIMNNVLRAEPQAVADFLSSTPGLYKRSIGWALGRRAKECSKEEEANFDDIDAAEEDVDFYSLVAQRYMRGINFHNTTVDEALRQLLFRVKLPGSSQYLRRLLKDFAIAYFRQNRTEAERLFGKAEGPYLAAYSIVMLNTDLHNPHVSRKMKRNEFTDSFQPMVPTLPREYVEGIYDRIKADELKVATEDAMTATTSTAPAPSGSSTNNGDADGKGKGFKGFFSRFF